MPYRMDFRGNADEVFNALVDLGALDIEAQGGAVAVLMPDSVPPERVASALGLEDMTLSPAIGRDDHSVWVLSPRAIRIGRTHLVPVATKVPGAIRLIDAPAFGTGLHPTTALCLQALDDILSVACPDAALDVGTGSGVLALAALMLGVRRVTAIDIEPGALRVAAENARMNRMEDRLELAHGGPETVAGVWPLVLANVLAAPLIEMAPAIVRRIGHHGHLVLSGIPSSVEKDVDSVYRRLGMRKAAVTSRDGWVAIVMQASW